MQHSGNFTFQRSGSEDTSDVLGSLLSDSVSDSHRSSELFSFSSTSKHTTATRMSQYSNSPEWLKIDKLRFEALSLYGRDEELSILEKSLERLSSGVVERQLILISGESGAGKSALAHSLKTPTTKLNGFFVRGKFDFNNRHEPYSGIILACTEICHHILSLRKDNSDVFEKVSQLIKDGLGSELALLSKLIPSLIEVTDFHYEDPSFQVEGSTCEEAKNRFHFAFQRFVRIISNEFFPLVIALDDLQWADGSSLDLASSCLSDLWIKKLMVIGTYRSNEVDRADFLNNSVAKFVTNCEEELFGLTQMTIENLGVNAVNQIIRVLLSIDDDAITMGLAEVCFKKTHGNPFGVLQFMQMVCDNGLLKYNYGSFSWDWNNVEIDSNTSVTSNVADLLKNKMADLPKHLLEILKIAACLGATFDDRCLRLVWENSSAEPSPKKGDDGDALTSGLLFLEKDGYIVRHKRGTSLLQSQSFSWTHDKIQEAAMMLIPAEGRAAFHRVAGDILLSSLGTAALGSAIFVVANLLNASEEPSSNDERRLILARLNYDASLRALSISAFESVADYAGKGIRLLPVDHWNDHYELSIGLYSVLAQAEGFLGNTDLMKHYCSIVLAQEEKPILDKMRVYHTLVNSMVVQAQFEEAADLILSVLAKCNCLFPTNNVFIMAGLINSSVKIKALMKSFDPDTITNSNNPLTFEITKFCDKLIDCLYFQKDARAPLVMFRLVDLTIQQGRSDYSSVAFAMVGMLLIGFLNDFKSGTWYGEQALKLMQKCKLSASRSRTLYIVHSFIYFWTKPIAQLVKPLQHAYNEGLQSGDVNVAGFSNISWLYVRYLMGNPLGALEKDLRLYSKQMEYCKAKISSDCLHFFHQAILNLMGCNTNSKLIGEVISEEDYQQYKQDLRISPALMVWEGMLTTYFGNHVQHANTTIQYGHDYVQKNYPCNPFIPCDSFLKCISCFAAAKETGKRKYSKLGQKIRSKIKRWREMGNPNLMRYETFLDAEFAALNNKHNEAIRHYQVAIKCAGRAGFLQDAAFACERLAEFHLAGTGDKEEAAFQMNRSIRYWRDWGARAKVEVLERKYSQLFPQPLSEANKTTR